MTTADIRSSYTVVATGEVFLYGTPVIYDTRRGIEIVTWCRQELGEINTTWGLYYAGGAQWWFKYEEDWVRYMLTWG